MKVTKLTENLCEVKIPWYTWSMKKGLVKALLQIQSEGRTITAISRHTTFNSYFLVCTK